MSWVRVPPSTQDKPCKIYFLQGFLFLFTPTASFAPHPVYPTRPERAEAPSPGHRPGLLQTQTCRPVRAKALKLQAKYKAFSLTGRIADCHHTQGDALGYELLPFQGVLLLEFGAISLYFNHMRKIKSSLLPSSHQRNLRLGVNLMKGARHQRIANYRAADVKILTQETYQKISAL